MSAAIAGSEVAMTVESMFSMNRATATTRGMMRCASIALEQSHDGCRRTCNDAVGSLSPFGERVGVRGIQNHRRL
jgi:hypothetical protein